MKTTLLLSLIALAGCARDQSPYLAPVQTFSQYYGSLPKEQQKYAGYGYTYGQNDLMQKMDAAYRNMQSFNVPSRSSNRQTSLRTKLISLPVPGYRDENGVLRDPSQKYIEVETTE